MCENKLKSAHPDAGFTVLELLTVLLLLGITAAIAVPGWQTLIADNRLNVATNALVMNLQRARSEALKRNTVVLVCPGDSHVGCRTQGNWSEGWLVFVDTNDNRQVDVGEPIISEVIPEPNTVIRTTRHSTPIAFHYDGRSPGSNTTWTVCDPQSRARTRRIILSNEGRIRTTSTEAEQKCL